MRAPVLWAVLALVLSSRGALAEPLQHDATSRPATATTGPWLEVQAGPSWLHESGRSGLGGGPLVRMSLGLGLAERVATEVWLAGLLESAPLSAPGDRAIVGGGLAGRVRLWSFDDDGRLALWARAGAGWSAVASGSGLRGPTAFGGAALMFQPVVKRFAVGLELDGLASRGSLGWAVLPSLRCAL